MRQRWADLRRSAQPTNAGRALPSSSVVVGVAPASRMPKLLAQGVLMLLRSILGRQRDDLAPENMRPQGFRLCQQPSGGCVYIWEHEIF